MDSPPPPVPRHSSYFPSHSPPVPSAPPTSASPQTASPVPASRTSSLRRLRDLPQHSSASVIKGHAGLAIRLSETTAEFIQKLATVHRQHATQLANLVSSYRKKDQEFKKNPAYSPGSMFSAWEHLLDTTEGESTSFVELANNLLDTISLELMAHTARKKLLFKKLFQYRASLTSKVEKSEHDVTKLLREYTEQWSKYSEAMDKDQVKDHHILLSYNSHNNYVMQLSAFGSLHERTYKHHFYSMLDEIQGIHNDLSGGFQTHLQKYVELCQGKVEQTQTGLSQLGQAVSAIESAQDVDGFVTQNKSSVVYPPPKPMFEQMDRTHDKLPDLANSLQLIDLTQAPLMHIMENLKKDESRQKLLLEKQQTEYESVQNLLESYRSNPALGDAHSLEVEMALMRHTMRDKESDLALLQGKLSVFQDLEIAGLSFMESAAIDSKDEDGSSLMDGDYCFRGNPQRRSELLVKGKEHEWAEITKKRPLQCRYCSGIIQTPIRPGFTCRVCRVCVHSKCQVYYPYCSGAPPAPRSPKLRKKVSKMVKRITSYPSVESKDSAEINPSSDSTGLGSTPGEESGGVYCTIDSVHPRPPPRTESLDQKRKSQVTGQYRVIERESMFEPSGEWELPTHCVALYDYDKFNPNDMPLRTGDVIELINTASPDWWKGLANGNKGYFPAQYVQVVNPGEVIMRVLYDFTAGEGELNLVEGQVVVMMRDDNDGWLYGRDKENEGLFPQSYVEVIAKV